MEVVIALAVWFIIAVVFFYFIRIEATKQQVDFHVFQLAVAVFWPVWLIWYVYTLGTERYKKK